MRKTNQVQKDKRYRFETDIEKELREDREIDAYHREIENKLIERVYIRTEYLD